MCDSVQNMAFSSEYSYYFNNTSENTFNPTSYHQFVLVEMSQLEQLLQHCPFCGKGPVHHRQSGRKITWSKEATSLTAHLRCSCGSKSGSSRKSWSTQSYIPGTKIRAGNVAVAASAHLSSISFANLSSFFYAANIPRMSKETFHNYSTGHIWPAIRKEYHRQQDELYNSLPQDITV